VFVFGVARGDAYIHAQAVEIAAKDKGLCDAIKDTSGNFLSLAARAEIFKNDRKFVSADTGYHVR